MLIRCPIGAASAKGTSAAERLRSPLACPETDASPAESNEHIMHVPVHVTHLTAVAVRIHDLIASQCKPAPISAIMCVCVKFAI